MVELRTTIRALTHLTGHAAFDPGSPEMLTCLVRNLSPIGACLVFCRDVTVPDCFDLFLTPSDRPYRALTIWQQANEAGIRFLDGSANAPEVIPDGDRTQP